VTSALDKSCNRDNFIFRRDLQKLRHGGLPPGQFFGTLLRVKYASEGEAGTRNGSGATNVYYRNPRAIMCKALAP
jgi:hypothetical protein